jgi:hypothetical protein
VTLAAAAAMGPEWRTDKERPRALCSIPGYDYRDASRYSRIETSKSFTATLSPATTTTGKATDPRISPALRTFTQTTTALTVDHCTMSRISVTLFDDGGYTVSFRAEQNASFTQKPQQGAGGHVVSNLGAVPRDKPDQLLNTGHLRRNEFNVRLRFYGAPPATTTGKSDAIVPGPVLMTLDLNPFMVQRGEPVEYFHAAGGNPGVRILFNLVERVEVDLRYK